MGGCSLLTETDLARKECKARSVLNKFKEMETKVINGEEDGKDQQYSSHDALCLTDCGDRLNERILN